MVDAVGVEGARAPDQAVDFVSFFQEEFRQVRSVLARDPRDERSFHGFLPFFRFFCPVFFCEKAGPFPPGFR
jgi:hypothetical protein